MLNLKGRGELTASDVQLVMGPVDFVSFVVRVSGVVTVEMHGGTLADPYIAVRRCAIADWDENDTLARDDDSGPGLDALVEFSGLEGARYTVALSTPNPYGRGTYTYSITQARTRAAAVPARWADVGDKETPSGAGDSENSVR